jgi:hypothetical protein
MVKQFVLPERVSVLIVNAVVILNPPPTTAGDTAEVVIVALALAIPVPLLALVA